MAMRRFGAVPRTLEPAEPDLDAVALAVEQGVVWDGLLAAAR